MKNYKIMAEIVFIHKMVKQKQKNIMKITKKVFLKEYDFSKGIFYLRIGEGWVALGDLNIIHNSGFYELSTFQVYKRN